MSYNAGGFTLRSVISGGQAVQSSKSYGGVAAQHLADLNGASFPGMQQELCTHFQLLKQLLKLLKQLQEIQKGIKGPVLTPPIQTDSSGISVESAASKAVDVHTAGCFASAVK